MPATAISGQIFSSAAIPYLVSPTIGYEPVGVFLPQGEFSTLFFSETPMSPEHFLLVPQSGDWGVCEL